jgi:hypothetical protein
MNELLRNGILVEDSTCVVSYNHRAVQGPRAEIYHDVGRPVLLYFPQKRTREAVASLHNRYLLRDRRS